MKRGFSLVELSIVLVILGLLVGGILAGQSLIRASEIRNVGTSLNNYLTAYHAFREKYGQIPGDFNNAAAIWTACTDGTNNNCNGNGDSQLTVGSCSGNNSIEGHRAWQHMALAGMIEGNYNALSANCTVSLSNANPGTNVPRLRMADVGVMLWYCGWCDANLTNAYGNVFGIGKRSGNALEAGLMTGTELWNLDTKMDDGLPAGGRMRGVNDTVNTCASTTAYNLTSTDKSCRIFYKATM